MRGRTAKPAEDTGSRGSGLEDFSVSGTRPWDLAKAGDHARLEATLSALLLPRIARP